MDRLQGPINDPGGNLGNWYPFQFFINTDWFGTVLVFVLSNIGVSANVTIFPYHDNVGDWKASCTSFVTITASARVRALQIFTVL
jgi:hypothetical protein